MRRFLLPWQKKNLRFFTTDILVLGSGIAGLYTAIKAAGKYQVTVLTKRNIEESNTEHAQGGIAAAMDKADSPSIHFEDTLNAGGGLCDTEAVHALVEEGPRRVSELIKMGANFDRIGGLLAFTREAAHSRRRILHAQGDATGYEIERTLVTQAKKQPEIDVREDHFVIDILTDKLGNAIGAISLNAKTGELEGYLAGAVVLATGGLGQIYKYTTNPEVATGDGIVAAYRAGAELMDMEFIQFHPTALLIPGAPRFLISEAVRGEGAVLINKRGKRFMEDVSGRELAPRDIVARAIWKEMNEQGSVYLDFRTIEREKILERFPKIYQTCLEYGIDVTKTPVPVAPAVHYMMGGIRTNVFGQTKVNNLYAAGECACNGVHGANRLASNSLLDGLVFGGRIVDKLFEKRIELPSWDRVIEPSLNEFPVREEQDIGSLKKMLQNIMWEKVGIIRNEDGLSEAVEILKSVSRKIMPQGEVEELELDNMFTLGIIVTQAALSREESRGGHFRSDYPTTNDQDWQKHSIQSKEDTNVGYVSN